jgi:predicted ABC-class ATPase
MLPLPALRQKLAAIDGQDYASCQSLLGTYDFCPFKLIIQQIPKDPYAPPHTGIYRIQIPRHGEGIVRLQTDTPLQNAASADFLARLFYSACEKECPGRRGTGFSGIITINKPGQAILARNSVMITEQFIEVRCFVGVPAHGRKVKAEIAEKMLLDELPAIVKRSLTEKHIDRERLKKHIDVAEDAEYLRNNLHSLGLIGFIANQSVLPRESGTSDLPMDARQAIPFKSPDRFEVEMDLPNAGKIAGMGIPRGVTLITGGGYHGKSTLLKTLERGIYNHIPGDGREYCVSNIQSLKIRAYSGRSVVKTDISPFIRNLPFDQDTTSFCTENASGSTSQAANIIEAIEAGAEVLLMDEDTCATNFMIRDSKMQQLVAKKDEPITTYIDRVKQLFMDKNISTVLVLGGVGEYFDVADHVIQMINFRPQDVTEKAHQIADQFPAKRNAEDTSYPLAIHDRTLLARSINPLNEHGKFSVYAKEIHRLNFGNQTIDLTDVEQLTELSQTKALGFALVYAKQFMDEHLPLREVVKSVSAIIEKQGLDVISDKISGHFAWFRALELALAINRIRGLEVVKT